MPKRAVPSSLNGEHYFRSVSFGLKLKATVPSSSSRKNRVPFGLYHLCSRELCPEQRFPRTLWLEPLLPRELWPEQRFHRTLCLEPLLPREHWPEQRFPPTLCLVPLLPRELWPD